MIHIIHHNDTDGYGAKYAAWKKFGNTAKYYPINYGMDFPVEDLKKEDTVYLLDFTFPKAIMDDLSIKCDLVVYDHHKTAINECGKEKYFNGCLEKSGCVLAWEAFHPKAPVPYILLTIQDWDLWRFRLHNTKAVHVMAECYKEDMNFWDKNKEFSDKMLDKAYCMYDNHKHAVEMLSTKAWKGIYETYNAIIINAGYPFISDVGNYLLEKNEDVQLAVIFTIGKDSVTYSLRSRSGGPDVSAIAKKYGGGGHANAAGYRQNVTFKIGE